MNLSKFKNLISANALSIFGYFYLLLCILVLFVCSEVYNKPVTPEVELEKMFDPIACYTIALFNLAGCLIISLITFFIGVGEFALGEKGKIKRFNFANNKLHGILFWLGIALQFSPLLLVLVFTAVPFVHSFLSFMGF